MKKIIPSLFFSFCFFFASAQYRVQILPRLSPDKMVYQKIGYTEVQVNYGSPKVKGRNIWGKLVPYNEIWRSGANEATTVSFSDDVEIENQILPAGEYAFYLIPRKNEKWTVIFNKMSEQWGAYSYNPEENQLTFEVLPRTSGGFHEELTYSFEQINFHYARLILNWESLELSFEIETEFENNLVKLTNEEIAESPENIHWVIYLQAAEFLVSQNRNSDQYFTWLKKSEELSQLVDESTWSHQYYPIEFVKGHLYWTIANAYANEKDYATSIMYADKLLAIDGDVTFYNWENEAEGIDEKIAIWKSK